MAAERRNTARQIEPHVHARSLSGRVVRAPHRRRPRSLPEVPLSTARCTASHPKVPFRLTTNVSAVSWASGVSMLGACLGVLRSVEWCIGAVALSIALHLREARCAGAGAASQRVCARARSASVSLGRHVTRRDRSCTGRRWSFAFSASLAEDRCWSSLQASLGAPPSRHLSCRCRTWSHVSG
jgi:hypothetical protein